MSELDYAATMRRERTAAERLSQVLANLHVLHYAVDGQSWDDPIRMCKECKKKWPCPTEKSTRPSGMS